MASSVRQRKHLLEIMHADFQKHKLEKTVEFYKYLQVADKPLGMPVIRKHFKKWNMALRQLETVYPDVFNHTVVEKKPAVKKAPLAAKKSGEKDGD